MKHVKRWMSSPDFAICDSQLAAHMHSVSRVKSQWFKSGSLPTEIRFENICQSTWRIFVGVESWIFNPFHTVGVATSQGVFGEQWTVNHIGFGFKESNYLLTENMEDTINILYVPIYILIYTYIYVQFYIPIHKYPGFTIIHGGSTGNCGISSWYGDKHLMSASVATWDIYQEDLAQEALEKHRVLSCCWLGSWKS